ncbi:hypothetical protein Anas_00036 [Armadillidium nasatum]|uniref:Uncharacterized protein n=1 Tax=Armadillidium nasatum TaxID=96803 RepID=A0A5N5TN26_9CRUS|nr:hypothetical protein Anas_00036 [Armadillidium nasatum]
MISSSLYSSKRQSPVFFKHFFSNVRCFKCERNSKEFTFGNFHVVVFFIRPSSPLDNVSFFTHKTNINNNYNSYNNNNNTINNNHKKSKGWSPHVRQKSTTVNFTAEELRAFKARRAAQENLLSSTGELRSEMSSQDSSPSSSPLRPLTRAFSMGEPFHFINGEEKISTEIGYSESKLDSTLTSGSVDISSGHDGPITAHPAQVTEEIPAEPEKCLPADTLSASMISLEESTLPSSLTSMTFAQRQSPTVLSDVSSSVTSSTSSLASTLSSSSSTLVSSSSSSSSTSCKTMSSSVPKSYFNRLDYKKVLSSIGTCPSMSLPHLSPEETADRANIIVLTYGRTPKAEILTCDKLSMEFVQMGKWDSKLKALLAPAPPYKCMGSYMDGIFALEIRKDLLCASHAQHPDVHSVNLKQRNDGKASQTTNFSGFSSGESKGTSLSSLPVAEVNQRESSKNTCADSNLNSKKVKWFLSGGTNK